MCFLCCRHSIFIYFLLELQVQNFNYTVFLLRKKKLLDMIFVDLNIRFIRLVRKTAESDF